MPCWRSSCKQKQEEEIAGGGNSAYKLFAFGQRYSHICNYFTSKNFLDKLLYLNGLIRFGAEGRPAIFGGHTPKRWLDMTLTRTGR